jgi:hypothetical protein
MIRRLNLLLVALVAPLLISSSAAAVWNPFGGQAIDCGNATHTSNSAICQDSQNPGKNPLTGTNGVILKVADIIAVVAGVAAVIIIILGGLRLIQSGGNPENIAGARRSIIYALVGIVVIVLSRVILGLVITSI